MNIALLEQWKPYEGLIPAKKLTKHLAATLSVLPEVPVRVIPSFTMGQDGPHVSSVYLVTTSYLVESRVNTSNPIDFDISLLKTISNYRVTTGLMKVSKGAGKDKNELTYQTGTVTLVHTSGDMESVATYFGSNVDDWLNAVLLAIPMDLLKYSAPKAGAQ